VLSPFAIAVDGAGINPLLFATNGFIGFDEPVVRTGGGADDGKHKHDYYHVDVYPVVEPVRKVKTKEYAPVLDEPVEIVEQIDYAAISAKRSNDIVMEYNRRMADAILKYEYHIVDDIERLRLLDDYAMVLLLLDD